MTTKEKEHILATKGFDSFEEFVKQCFPNDGHVRRLAAKALGERWGKEALAQLRKDIEIGDFSTATPITPQNKHPSHSLPIARRSSQGARRVSGVRRIAPKARVR